MSPPKKPKRQTDELNNHAIGIFGRFRLGQLQLIPVRSDGMQVGAVKCRFICS
jgi:hypothetical protein